MLGSNRLPKKHHGWQVSMARPEGSCQFPKTKGEIRMLKHILSVVTIVAMVIFVSGCTPPPAATPTTPPGKDKGDNTTSAGLPSSDATVPVAAYCAACGEVDGSEKCCKDGVAKCEHCSRHKGSPLCCVDLGDGVEGKVCAKCGEVAGGEKCCKEGAEICTKCKLHKGSPLCCKLKSCA